MISCSELKKANPYLFNSWRAILYTEKGKRAGIVDGWRKFSTFFEDVHNSYKKGLRLSRKDKDKPFGPDNFEWVTNLELAQTAKDTVWLTYKGETKTLREWSEEFGMSYNGLRQRYFRNKNYSIEEILFGKKRKIRGSSREYNLKTRASKLLSSYKLKDWKFIIDERKVAGLIKPPSFYLFNENNGLKLFINNTEKSSSLNTKSLKAICSDGRVYFDDWSEMLLSEEQPITSSSKNLSIGYNSTIYTQMAFKNLGIYNDQLLSKDDCIKAYNYLQTLKAK